MAEKSDYKKMFIQESDELLQQMNKSLLVLERDPQNKDAINAIFRSAHTLKSMSASMGYTDISDLSHKMEDVLTRIREGAVEIAVELVDLFFSIFDSLEKMVGEVQEGKEGKGDIEPLIEALENYLEKEISFEEESVSDDVSLNTFEKRTLARVKKDGFFTFHVKVKLEPSCVLKSVRAFMVFRNLHEFGEVIKSFPNGQKLEEEKFEDRFSFIFVTKEKESLVHDKTLEVLEVESVVVEKLPVDEMWDDEGFEKSSINRAGISSISDFSQSTEHHIRNIKSVRVDIDKLDKMMNLVEELAINKLRLIEVGSLYPDANFKSIIEGLNRLTDELQTTVMQARLVPVKQIFDRFPRMVRDFAKKNGKSIKFDVIGGDIELDRTVLDEIGDPLIHLIRNAVDHGVEMTEEREKLGKSSEGRVMLSAIREKGFVSISVEDDGRGLDIERIKSKAVDKGIVSSEELERLSEQDVYLLCTHPGFSTKESVSEISGRGVGLDVVKEKVESLGGGVRVESILGRGAKISMRLPITTAVVQALLIEVLNRSFAIPISSVLEIIVIKEADIKKVEHQETIIHRDRVLPILRLSNVFGSVIDANDVENQVEEGKLSVVVLESTSDQYGIVVDRLISQQDIVIKQLTKELRGVRGFAGATILGDGSVALVLDVSTLI